MLILLMENSGEWYLICITLFFPLWFARPQRAGDAVELPPARAALPFQASAAKSARNVAVTYLELQLLPGSALGGVGVPAFSSLFYIFSLLKMLAWKQAGGLLWAVPPKVI